jgi:L-aminopeptidase/D-esterase-like protein
MLAARGGQISDNAGMAITDVPGLRVGHWTNAEAKTGCTVVLLPDEGAVAGVDVRGPAPGTRETDLLRPGRTIERVHAICLCGGSAFGLGAADGVMRFLSERGVGLPVGSVRLPLVPAAVLFDLMHGRPAWPGPDEGYAACAAASADPPAEGRVGAGTGATVSKVMGRDGARPGGVGTASLRLPGGAVVAALAVANAVGDVYGRDGRLVTGGLGPDGQPADGWQVLLKGGGQPPPAGSNTTIAVVATDAALDKAGCRRLAEAGQDGLALAIRPAHTPYDGDTVFAVSAGTVQADAISLGVAAAEVMWRAIERAVTRG